MNGMRFLINDGVPTFLGGIIFLVIGGIIYVVLMAALVAVVLGLFYSLWLIPWLFSLGLPNWVIIVGGLLFVFIIAALQSIWVGLRQNDD